MTTYTKGQRVTYICNWDRKGTFAFRPAIVESCGTKKMTLRCEETGAMMGRDFIPVIGEMWSETYVFPGMTDAEAEAKCSELAALYVAKEKARYQALIDEMLGNAKYFQNELDKLHEPRTLKKTWAVPH